MELTLEQARSFVAIANEGTIQKAAKSLKKGHSALLYSMKNLEEQTQLKLFDRSEYRNKISEEGRIVLKYCHQLLDLEKELAEVCRKIRSGHEARLSLVYDAVVDFDLLSEAFLSLNRPQIPTEVKIQSAFLNQVEQLYLEENADFMVTILPIHRQELESIALPQIEMLLVVHKDHPLNNRNKLIDLKTLYNYPFVRIRESTQLGLSTEKLTFNSTITVNDFMGKKKSILNKLGFGWLPRYLIETELKSKVLVPLNTKIENSCLFQPQLFHKKEHLLGKSGQQLIDHFLNKEK